jgi:uncharacterized oligopeptide transporter (OPT) family protein
MSLRIAFFILLVISLCAILGGLFKSSDSGTSIAGGIGVIAAVAIQCVERRLMSLEAKLAKFERGPELAT